MITGETKTGFKFSIDENVTNDMRMLDAICDVQAGEKLKVTKIIALLLGDDKERLYAHVAEKDGRVPVEKIEAEILDIFNAFGESGKNS